MTESAWIGIKAFIKDQLPEHSYRMWIKPLQFCKTRNGDAILSCPNSFSKKQIVKKYGKLLESSVQNIMGKKASLSFKIFKSDNSSILKSEAKKIQIALPGMDVQPSWARKLRKDFTFEQFVVGANNDFAYSAALSIASKEAGGLNSLFLLSNTGLGKSHLSQAVGHHIISKFPDKRVYYVTAEDFTNEMVVSYKNNDIAHFKDKYRQKCDVLLIDDVQYFSGKIGTQKELVGTLDFLMDNGKKIIFASSELPSNIPKLSDKLKSRLCGGLVSNLEPPDYGTRAKILRQKAKINGYKLPGEVIQYLAGEISGDVRQLESGLVGVAAKASLMGINPDLAFAEGVIKNIVNRQSSVTMDSIQKLICEHYNIAVQDLVSTSRRRGIVWPRQVAIYLARKYTDHSLQSIGKVFNRYHATCMYAVKAVDKAVNNDVAAQNQIHLLSTQMGFDAF